MANNQPVTKIYELKVIGFDNAKVEVAKMSAELEKLKKKKQDLDKEFAKASSTVQAAQVNQQIQAQVTLETELTKRIAEKNKEIKLGESLQENNGATGVGAAITAYQNLVKQYKEAVATSQEMEAQFGKESAEAIEAAKTAAIYEAELVKINKLRGQAVTNPENIPFTSNLAALEAEQAALKQTGTVVSEFDLQQRDAANAATALGQTQLTTAEQVQSTSSSFQGVIGSLDQYTGSLRDNIKAQLENAQAIAANKAAQKEIADSIKQSGTASESQITQLTALKEEFVILDQSQKSLTTTIRNQAREFVAANGSIEEGRAKINQLQQAYAQLSEAERAQPFGQGIKQEIDILEPKIKELEAQIGLFQRNVGNYPTAFTGAFKVLETELDTLQGKLVSGNFSGKELEEVTKKTATLKAVTSELNQTFKSTTQEQTAYKEAARQVAQTFGTESTVFQTFVGEVGKGNAELKKTDVVLKGVEEGGKKAGNIFKTIGSSLRSIVNIVPNFGFQALILLLLAPLEALASKIAEVATSSFKASDATKDFKLHLEEMSAAVHESQKGFVDAFTAVESLRINVDLAKEGFLKKDDVLKQYNDTMGKTTGKLTDFSQIEDKITKAGPAYIQMMLLRAAANVALESAAKKAFEAAEASRKQDIEFSTFLNRFNTAVSSAPGVVPDNGAEERARKAREKSAQEAKAKVIKEAEDAKKLQLSIADDFQKQAAELQKKNNFSFIPEPDAKKTRERADRLNVQEQNALKVIDATLKGELAVENERFTEIEKVHVATYDEEIQHAKRIEEINVNALNSKISLLSKQKNKNAEELATLADFKEKRSAIELQTSQQIQEIEKKRFADQNKDLQASLEDNIKQAKEAQKAVLDNPDTSNIERARANLEFIDTEIIAYRQYYTQLLALNSNYNKEALQKVRDHLKDLQIERSGGQRAEILSTEKDIQAQGERDINQINVEYGLMRNSILINERITDTERQRLLENFASANRITILSKELETLNKQLQEKAELLLQGLASEDEYNKLHLAAINKAGDLEAAVRAANQKKIDDAIKRKPKTVEQTATSGVNDLLGNEEGSEQAKAVGEAISQSFSLATDAMHSYYDAERQRIQDSLNFNLQRLDLEKEQVKSRAQSQAELASIDKQYDDKKKAAQKKAGEETKKTKRAELKIALVTELANDAVAAAAYPFPFSLGIFAAMSALALGRYAVGLGQINAQQFAYGGQVPQRGGKFGGKRHSAGGTPFHFKGERYEAEVDELAIIRTRNAPARNKVFQIVGTHQQIASQLNVLGGGISFSPGAKLKRFAEGGMLGGNLQAPVFVPSSQTNVFNSDNKEVIAAIERQNDSISRYAAKIDTWQQQLEVHQVTSTVTTAQKKQVQQKAIGTL